MAVVGWPLVAASVTAAAFLLLRRVPSSLASPWDLFLAMLGIAAVNAAISAGVPAVTAARLWTGRAAGKAVVVVACGTAALLIYLFACFVARSLIIR